MSEAERHLGQAEALSDSDPVKALGEAQRANDLASQAFELARSDVSEFTRQDSYGGMPRGSDGADLGEAVVKLFNDPQRRAAMGAAGIAAVARERGAVDRVMQVVESVMAEDFEQPTD